jgi:Disulphide bond corrector protein DsbC
LVPSHDIFHTPLKVNPTFEDMPTPGNYFELAGDKKLDKTIKVWRVQTKKFPEIDPGLVSNPSGFDGSPDAEVISSGLNSKGPDSVALARHGNFFLWGFSASPRDMTPEARKCFVNVVCYIKKFDGQKPVVRVSVGGTRDRAVLYAYYLRTVRNEDTFRQSLPRAIRDDPQQYTRHRESVMSLYGRIYPEEFRRRYGDDPEEYTRFIEENIEYLRHVGDDFGLGMRFEVDEDVKALGLSNRKVELLDKCIAMMEQGDRPDLALRILKRYTTEDFDDAKQWRSWLEANRDRLFFTDVGGFKFLVAPESLAKLKRKEGSVQTTEEPDARNPVIARAELSPSKVRLGETLTLVVRVETAPAWHIYDAQGTGGPGVPTTLKLKLPEGVEAEGDWTYPKPRRGSDGQMIYEGKLEFRHELRVGSDAGRGPIQVMCEIGYQACDLLSCRPPTTVTLEAEAEVIDNRR